MKKQMRKAAETITKVRQDALVENFRDQSTGAINMQIEHASTLIDTFEAQRTNALLNISELQNDVKRCEKMIGGLHVDIATLQGLVRARRS